MSGKIEKITLETEKHEGGVTCCIYVNKLLYSSGADGKIMIWDNNLNLIKKIGVHDCHIYAMCSDSNGKLYTSSCDGTIKYLDDLGLNSSKPHELVNQCTDEIESLATFQDILFSGDDKGVVTMWVDGKIKFKYNLVEEVQSMAFEKDTLYTIRNLDLVVTTIKDEKYMTRATIPGKSPLYLFGSLSSDRKKKWILILTRDGKGLTMIKNNITERFPIVWTKESAHEMIINSICGRENSFYTGGYDGFVKKWINVETFPQLLAQVDLQVCINTICDNSSEDNSIFVGCSDGMIRKINFE